MELRVLSSRSAFVEGGEVGLSFGARLRQWTPPAAAAGALDWLPFVGAECHHGVDAVQCAPDRCPQ